ncbi:MAG: hypothetical protein MOGMAGMI_02061 [Candidatus Omnitrophica bacterium]|nr:hypothetical protein [Candidatus Omnitrophota bacterium]
MSFLIVGLFFVSLITAFMAVKMTNTMAKHRVQAIQVARGQVELLKATAFGAIANAVNVAAYDAGPDGIWGNADDFTGTLTVTVRDVADFDGDGNTAETAVDIDGDNVNDATAALPVRVTFTWAESVLGLTRNMTVTIDTLIAA